MGTLDDLRGTLGDDFFTTPARTGEESRVSWQPLCVCGHLSRYHSPTVGGTYVMPEPGTRINRGVSYNQVIVFNGCRGALALRNVDIETDVTDHETKIITKTIVPTCPCDEFREVAQVDRPNRYFNQRLPLDLDPDRHPFLIGLRAFTKHLTKRRAALADPTWVDREFDRRFTWSDSKRICSISKCTKTDGVLPTFVTDGSDRSELRCPAHR